MDATLLDELERLNRVRVAEREVGIALLALRLEDGDEAAHEAAVVRLREAAARREVIYQEVSARPIDLGDGFAVEVRR